MIVLRASVPVLAACLTLAPAGAQTELPAVRIVRIQTTVWAPAYHDRPFMGVQTTVERPLRSGWYVVGAGPRRPVPVFVSERVVDDEPELIHGFDRFVLAGLMDTPAQSDEGPTPDRALLENARDHLRRGEDQAAIENYRAHLQGAPRDAVARRELGLALLRAARIEEAGDTLFEAYHADDALTGTPLSLELIGGSAGAFSPLATRAFSIAQRRDDPRSWLIALVLAQADGRVRAMKKLAQSARRAGLDAAICERFAQADASAAPAPASTPSTAPRPETPVTKPTPPR
ncbi:MAG: tetratricopeptide repeat protein [Phycisphaerales bacterium]